MLLLSTLCLVSSAANKLFRHTPTVDAQSEASFARGTSAEVSAHRAVLQINDATQRTNDLIESTGALQAPMLAAVEKAKESLKNTKVYQAAALKALQKEKTIIASAEGWAAEQATQAVDKQMGPRLRKVQEWKMAVLHDPKAEAEKAAQKAAAPYEKAMIKTEMKVSKLQAQAQVLGQRSYQLANVARANAKNAVAKQADVDLDGASQDMILAHQQMATAIYNGYQALGISANAQGLQINIPAYQAAAQGAALSTQHRYDPKDYPPPPVSPKAWNPPPPPTDV